MGFGFVFCFSGQGTVIFFAEQHFGFVLVRYKHFRLYPKSHMNTQVVSIRGLVPQNFSETFI